MTPRIPASSWLAALAMAAFVACSESPTAPPPPAECTYSLSASSLSFAAAGGPATVSVTTGASCSWSAQTTTPWLGITAGAAGTGNGVVSVTAQANPGADPRSGTLTVAGIAVALQQAAQVPTPCVYTITPSHASTGPEGGRGTVAVTTDAGCAWQVAQGAPWIRLVSGPSGTGPGIVEYAADANPASIPRTGTLTIAGRTFTLDQDGGVAGCSYEVAPVSIELCMTWHADQVVQIATQDGCPWTVASTASWITVMGDPSRTGSGQVVLRGEDNWAPRRLGVVEVRWPAARAGQNVVVDQGGCQYAVTRANIPVPVAGGADQFDVIQQSDPYTCGGPLQDACLWSAVAHVPWITITTAMPRTGDDRVNFVVAANPTSAPRVGTITVRDKLVTVVQAGL